MSTLFANILQYNYQPFHRLIDGPSRIRVLLRRNRSAKTRRNRSPKNALCQKTRSNRPAKNALLKLEEIAPLKRRQIIEEIALLKTAAKYWTDCWPSLIEPTAMPCDSGYIRKNGIARESSGIGSKGGVFPHPPSEPKPLHLFTGKIIPTPSLIPPGGIQVETIIPLESITQRGSRTTLTTVII